MRYGAVSPSAGATLTGVVLGYLGAALAVIALRAVRSSVGRGGIPFAPFIASGALVAVLFVR
jgi:prepilin signal peptidase PulO-like enzyme (type II secretory pathway)